MTKLRHPKSQPGIPAQESLQANLHKSAGNKSHKSRADSRKGAEANLAKHWQYWRLNMDMIGLGARSPIILPAPRSTGKISNDGVESER